MNEYASWKDLLVPVYPHYRGPFILLDCGWLGSRSYRPMSRHRLATLALAHDHSLLSANQNPDRIWHNETQLEATLASQPQAGPRKVQVCINILKNQKTQTLSEPPK